MNRKLENRSEIQTFNRTAEHPTGQQNRSQFVLEETNRSIEELVDEGIRISRSLADEKSENPELLRKMEREKEDRLRARERKQKQIAVELLLNSERDLSHADLSLERKIFREETERVSRLLSDEKISLSQSQAETATRDQFLAMVSHDLRNPLTSIFLSAEVLRKSILDNNLKAQDLLKLTLMIERNATVMQRMITHLLDAERVNQGKLTLSWQMHKVTGLLKDCEVLFGPAAAAKSINMSFVNDYESLSASFDYDRILQVMSNLIGNAIKFTPSKGSIRVSAWQVGSNLHVCVKDSGPGIPDENQNQIFDRFSQVKPSDHRGLGLGLFISRWIVEAHHGQIKVDSSLGQGSSFSFCLPTVLAH